MQHNRRFTELVGQLHETAIGDGSWEALAHGLGDCFDSNYALIAANISTRGTIETFGVHDDGAFEGTGVFKGLNAHQELVWQAKAGEQVLLGMPAEPRISLMVHQPNAFADDTVHILQAFFRTAENAMTFICLSRRPDRAPFTQDDARLIERLGRHISRALSSRQQVNRPSLFDTLPHALAVLDSHGRCTAMNPAAERLMAKKGDFSLMNGQICIAGSPVGDIGHAPLPSGSFVALHCDSCDGTMPEAMLAPLPEEWASLLDGAKPGALLIVSDPTQVPLGGLQIIARHYGLTHGEQRFAQALLMQRSLKAACLNLGIAEETGRRHIKSIFLKTETHSQADLLRLITTHPATIYFGGLGIEAPASSTGTSVVSARVGEAAPARKSRLSPFKAH